MSEERIIKKYPNRRLYDTVISCYVTLNDIKDLVLSYTPIKVIDAKSGEDLTRATLMQIISEQEEKNHPVFTSEILSCVIRSHGDLIQSMMSRYLQHSIKLFMEQKAGFKSPLNTFLGNNPVTMMQDIAEKNLHAWKNSEHYYSGNIEGNESKEITSKDSNYK